MLPLDRHVLKIFLGSDNEVSTYLMNPIQHLEVVVSTVKDIIEPDSYREFHSSPFESCTEASDNVEGMQVSAFPHHIMYAL